LDSPQIGYLFALILLLFLSGVFSASETAYSSVNVIRLKQMAKADNNRAKRALNQVNQYTKVLTTILVGNNIVNISATSLATYIFSVRFNEAGVLYAMLVMTVFILLFGEIIPKVLAKQHAEQIVIFMCLPIHWLMILLRPIVNLAAGVQSRFVDDENKKVTATEDELVEIVQTIEMEGVLDQEERELIESAILFDDKNVREVMRPRDEVVFLYDNATKDQIINVISTHKYSRIPVISYEGLHAVGIIRERDVLDCLLLDKPISMENLLRKVTFVSQRHRLQTALEKLQKSREHMAIVVENMKSMNFVGLITLEDILEEIVGEIYDEYDDLPRFVVEIGHHTYEVDGVVPIKQFFEDYLEDEPKPKTEAKTFAGWIDELAQGSRIRKNKEFIYQNMSLRVLGVKDYQAHKIELNVYSRMDADD
jgi:putative hemolysin